MVAYVCASTEMIDLKSKQQGSTGSWLNGQRTDDCKSLLLLSSPWLLFEFSSFFVWVGRGGDKEKLVGHGANTTFALLLEVLGDKHHGWGENSQNPPGDEQGETSMHSQIEGLPVVEDVLLRFSFALLEGDRLAEGDDEEEEKEGGRGHYETTEMRE